MPEYIVNLCSVMNFVYCNEMETKRGPNILSVSSFKYINIYVIT